MRAAAIDGKIGLSRLAIKSALLMAAIILSSGVGLPPALLLCMVALILLELCTPVMAASARRLADLTTPGRLKQYRGATT